MPPLRNIKHEQFVQTLASQLVDPTKRPSITSSYQQVYSSSYEASRFHGSRLMSYEAVRKRMSEVLEELGCSREWRVEQLRKLVSKGNNGIKLGAIKEMNRVDGLTDLPSSNTTIVANSEHFESELKDRALRYTSDKRNSVNKK